MNGAAGGTSRRAFLGRAAGAAVAVAGAGVGAGAFTQRAAAADNHSQAHRFTFEIDGVSCGGLGGAAGGNREGDVVLDAVGSDGIQRKHIAGVKYEDFTLQVGSGMGKGMYDWIKSSFDRREPRSASVVSYDSSRNERSRRAASQAYISSVTVPALDRTSTVPAYVAVGLSCAQVTTLPTKGTLYPAGKQKAWLPSNFVFEANGLDTSRVASIDSFTWKCTVAADGSVVMDVSDIGVTFPRADLSSWQDWFSSMMSGADDERDGALTLIGAQGGAVVTFSLENLGLYGLVPVTGNAKQVKAEMYCERASWDLAKGTKI